MLRAIIVIIITTIKFKIMLKKCLVKNTSTNIELFEYNGKVYDKNLFIQLKAESLNNLGISQRQLRKSLEEYESKLIKSKTPDLDMAIIEAYKRVIR